VTLHEKVPICAAGHVLIKVNELKNWLERAIFSGMESSMNTISLHLTGQLNRELRSSEVKQRVTEWWHCARSRHELQGLDDRCLQDIGMSRCAADFESTKPFWMP
jgi:uncharacterized protein YjiS (DUF1127 family)